MSLFPIIDDADATGKVRAVFDDIKATKGIDFVPAIWRALANNPDHLEQTWVKLKTIMQPGKLDLLTKETIALAVSITNGCEYCINSHSAAVLRLGLDREALGEIVAVTELFNGMNRIADAYQVPPDVRPFVM
jgi:AhpD family alkylhydroperoxidase